MPSTKEIFAFPPTKGFWKPNIAAALGLSLWQMVETVFTIYPSLKNTLGLPLYLMSGLAGFTVLIMLPGHFVRLIKATAVGDRFSVDWRQLTDIQNGLLTPLFKFILIGFWSFLPVEMYLALASKNHNLPSPWAVSLLAVFGLIYFPMALLMTAVTGKIMPSLLPSNVVEPIFKTFKRYILFLFPFWAFSLLPVLTFILWTIPIVGPFLSSFILIYLWTCAMKLLGEFYGKNKDVLKWQ